MAAGVIVLAGGLAFAVQEKPIPLDELMVQVQETYKEMVKYNRLTKAQFEAPGKTDDIAKNAEKMTELTKVILAHVPKADAKDKPKKAWTDSAQAVQKATIAMAKAARAKNQAEYRKTFKQMDASCTKCHDVFRDI
jgi:cytochrome c556